MYYKLITHTLLKSVNFVVGKEKTMFNLTKFISQHVTKRRTSMFSPDIDYNAEILFSKIKDKSILVIGGAGSIGSSFIKAILPFKPASLVVVDTNENALAELTRDLRSTKGMYVPEDYVTYPMDFASPVFEKMFIKRGGFDIVGNFSAHKHVRSEKDIYSVEALLQNNVLHAKLLLELLSQYPPEEYFCVSTDKAAYPINAMGTSKAMMEKVIFANARVAAQRGKTVICCTRYGNVMASRGSVIPLFVEQIKNGHPITITDPNMTRFLMNLDEAVDLVQFAFEHANPGDLFIQKADASTIGDLAKGVQKLFGDTGTRIIGTRHGEKLYETLMTREERLRAEDMGDYYRVAADNRDLNYDKFVVKGKVETMADEAYTSHNTKRLDVDGVVKKLLTTDYVQEELAKRLVDSTEEKKKKKKLESMGTKILKADKNKDNKLSKEEVKAVLKK